MIQCKNCVNFKEHSENEYECLKIYNIVIYDKEAKHACRFFIDKLNEAAIAQELLKKHLSVEELIYLGDNEPMWDNLSNAMKEALNYTNQKQVSDAAKLQIKAK